MKKMARNILLFGLLFLGVGIFLIALYRNRVDEYFWTLFISYICGGIITIYGICKTESSLGDSKIVEFSLEGVSLIYWIAFVCVVWKVTKFFKLAGLLHLYVAIHILMLIIFVVFVGLIMICSDYVKRQEGTLNKNCTSYKKLKQKIDVIHCMHNEIEDKVIKGAIAQLFESISYMDPVSSEKIHNYDNSIYVALDEFEKMLESKENFKASEIANKSNEIQKLIQLRNNVNIISK